jgi:exodeoxyribonuclease VII small subunit
MTNTQETTQETTQMGKYEQLHTELAQVVAQLEEGNMSLEDMLRLYEKGIQLATACQKLLDTAELRVQQLQESAQQQTLFQE